MLKRTFKEGVTNFWRNGWLSLAAVSVLTLSLFISGVLFVVLMAANGVLKNVQDKVNVSVYFKTDAPEERILAAKSDLEDYNEVKSVEYISREQALEDFKRNNANEPVIMKSLEEIGDNPLLASLIVKANNPNQYEAISDYVSSASFKDDVSRLNYGKNKEVIDKLNGLIAEVRKIGLVLAAIFAVISILITFNTIRITIYTHRSEIEVMRLVGASNPYIRLPFILEGVMYGLSAAVISMLILFAAVRLSAPYVSFLPLKDIVSFHASNLLILIGAELFLGVALGVISSWIAVRKYLKV